MRTRVKTIDSTYIFLLMLVLMMVLAFCGKLYAADSKSPAILLQEAIYAEQTEGDLDKAIKIYQQVVDQSGQTQRLAAKASYQLGMCYLKKGDNEKAAKFFQTVIRDYPKQKNTIKLARQQLNKIKPQIKSIYDMLSVQAVRFISRQYGQTGIEAFQKNLFSNSHIYYVDENFKYWQGGMAAYYNFKGRSETGKVFLGNSKSTNMTYYEAGGKKLNMEFVPDKNRPGFYKHYWLPDAPLPPRQALYYGWNIDQIRSVKETEKGRLLRMDNKFGMNVIETFFLVLPKKLTIGQGPAPTGKESLANFDVYWWTKEVPANTANIVEVVIEKNTNEIISDSFEKGNGVPQGWRKGQSVKGVKYIWDKKNGSDGKASLCLKKTARKYFPIAQWTRKVEHKGDAKKLSVYANVKARKCTKAILDALFLDKNGKWIKHQWVSYIGEDPHKKIPPANHNWKKYGGIVDIPENTKTIVIGLQIYGPGTVWFDELEVTYVKDTPTTQNGKVDKLACENLVAEGWALWKKRKLSEAEEKFKQAVGKNPKSDAAYQGLGWSQLNQGKRLNAKESFEKCVALNPKNSAALNGLGWLAEGQGNEDDAIKWWEKAVKASNGSATASLSGLTKVYMKRNEYDKAKKYYRIWLKFEPNNKQAKDGLKKIKQAKGDK